MLTIKPVYNGSQILEQQIASGAPADVFASADTTNMQKASQAGLVGASQIFVKNRLVVIILLSNPGKIMSLKDLARKGVKIDLEAATVPVGKYSRQALMNLSHSPQYGANYGSARRNIVVRGCTLSQLVGHTFRIGDVTLRGLAPRNSGDASESAQQVAPLESTEQAARCLVLPRADLRADVLTEGIISVGDRIEVM